jgi:hypothetical protein
MLDPRLVTQQIANLKLLYPQLLEDEEAWLSAIESETDVNHLLSAIVWRIEDSKAIVIGTQDRFEELKARKERYEHKVDVLRELAFKLMQAAELAKVTLPEATLSLRASAPQLVGDADPKELADRFCKISRSVDRTAIREALKDGQAVPGFQLSNSPPSLTIRIK